MSDSGRGENSDDSNVNDDSHEESDSEGSVKSNDTTVVDLQEQNKRLQAQIVKLRGEVVKVAKQAEKQRKEKNDLKVKQSTSSISSNSISLSLSQKPKTFDLGQNSAINPTKLHEHLNLIQGQVASGVIIERDSLTQLYTSRAQAALVQRYEAWRMINDSDGEKEQDVFNLPTTEFITLMYELFPIAHHTSALDVTRLSSGKFDRRWYAHKDFKVQIYSNQVFGQDLKLFNNGKFAAGNGNACTDAEFPAIRDAIYDIIHPETTLSAEDMTNSDKVAEFKTNQRLLDDIKSDPPKDLSSLRLALIHCSNAIVKQYQQAHDNGWIPPSKKRPRDRHNNKKLTNNNDDKDESEPRKGSNTYKGANPQPKCDKCSRHHHPKASCSTSSSHPKKQQEKPEAKGNKPWNNQGSKKKDSSKEAKKQGGLKRR